MGYTHKDLVEAGAPDLPEGYYYRVKTRPHGSLWAKIEVRIVEKRGFWPDLVVADNDITYRLDTGEIIDPSAHGAFTPAEAVLSACRTVYKQFEQNRQGDSAMAQLNALSGRYKG